LIGQIKVVNQAFLPLHRWPLEITLTVPLNVFLKRWFMYKNAKLFIFPGVDWWFGRFKDCCFACIVLKINIYIKNVLKNHF